VHDFTRATRFDVFMEAGSCFEILHLVNIHRLATLKAPLCDWLLGLRFVSSLSEHLLDIRVRVFIELEDPEASSGRVAQKCSGSFAWFLRAPMQPTHIVDLFVGGKLCYKK